jgi:nitrogen fixation/metabolism regulation signal transduction histidine kinase
VEETKPRFQRKTIIIKKSLQYRYMFIISFTALIAFLLVALDFIWDVYKVVENHPAIIPLLDEVFSDMPLMFLKLVIYMLIIIIASAVISHRIAGPVYKFEKSCDKISEGDLTHRVYLRKGDYLVDLQNSFNKMIDKLSEVIKINERLKQELRSKNIEVESIEKADSDIKKIMPNFKI